MDQPTQPKSTGSSAIWGQKKTENYLLEANRETAEAILERLRGSQRVLIGTHAHPDGDAIGSSLALYFALKIQGKEVTAYIPDAAPDYLRFVPGFDYLTTVMPNVMEYDTVVIVDCTKLYRAQLEQELIQHNNVIVIDHHLQNGGEGKYNLVIAEAAATAHILTELFRMGQVPITQDMATCLLTGIFTDTGSFMHDSTTPQILKLASELMRKGARLSHIAHETYQKKELPALKIWGEAFSRVMVNEETGAAISVITYRDLERYGASRDDLDGVVNMLNTLPQAKFALLLTEYEPGKIKGSLRSEVSKGVDVSKIAKRFGGGGHKLASGFEVDGRIVKKDGQWRVVRDV